MAALNVPCQLDIEAWRWRSVNLRIAKATFARWFELHLTRAAQFRRESITHHVDEIFGVEPIESCLRETI